MIKVRAWLSPHLRTWKDRDRAMERVKMAVDYERPAGAVAVYEFMYDEV